ncbi:unnamed protein product [Lymnaea stagnalis]|uniref:Transporter n=1 Tax=Lymnaea stagnalis TaxID=6523 RepID=A0AAV2I3N7_LYMST
MLTKPELPKPITLTKPELPKPITLTKPELPISTTLAKPEFPIPTTLAKPEFSIPTTLAKPELPKPSKLAKPELPKPSTLAKPELPISTTHTKPQLLLPSTHAKPDLPIRSICTKPEIPLPINSIKHEVPLSSTNIKTGISLPSNHTRQELSLPNTPTKPEFPLTISTLTKPEIPLPRALTKPEIPLPNTLSKPEIPLLSTSIKHEVPLPSALTKPNIRLSSWPTRGKQDLHLPSPQCKLDLHFPLCDSSSSLPLGQPLPSKRHSYVVFDPRLLEPQPLAPDQPADIFKITQPPKSDTSPNLPLLIAQTPSTEDLLDTPASDRDSNAGSSSGSENSLKLIKRLGSTGSQNRHLVPPKDFRVIKTKSESALSCFTFPSVTDPRTNSSHSNLVPPNDLISSNPRRDSAWTAEVLSMEIQVDYVMDPAELWGSEILNKPSSKDVSECGDMTEDSPTIPVTITSGEAPDQMDTTVPIPPGPEETKKPEEKEPTKDNTSRSRESIQLNLPPREHWENRFQFLLSTIGYAVDLSNVWRFPFLCYKNGGGAFLIPYFTTLIFGAMPVFFMEMCLGQFNRCGPTAIWEKMSPMFKGIGIASCFMAYIVAFYYNVIIGWSFFYLFASFTYRLPWTSCFNAFNSENCWQINWDTNATNATSDVGAADQIDADAKPWNRTYNVSTSLSSTMEYFERGMLELNYSTGLDDLGVVRWQLALCTFLTFTVLYFCLWKGVKSTGKVVYITATLPYVIMTILLVRGVLLPGAEDGIRYFITPKIDSLRKPKVWIDAAVQIFFSVGSGFGTHIAYASYNKFHNDCKRDCVITVIVNSLTSLFSGFVIFSYLGYMALKTHKDIDKVATEGPGLVFIVYPEAIATLPGSVGWAIIFFFMLLSLGLDSAFGGLESPLTGIRDELSQLMKYKYFREVLTLIIIMSAFIFSIPCLMQGGMYIFTMLDTFAAGTSIVFIVLCEVVAVSWIYGMPQFCADVEKMTGHKPSIFWRICWKFICPCLLTVIVASSIISYQPLTYRTSLTTYTYPYYANIVGWCIATSSMVMVPGYIVYKLIRTKGSFKQRIALCISPAREHEEIQQKGIVKRFQRSHWLSL